jgi:hypothetical protein
MIGAFEGTARYAEGPMKQTYRPQAGLRRRSVGGFNREHLAFIAGLLLTAAFEVLLAAKGWSF